LDEKKRKFAGLLGIILASFILAVVVAGQEIKQEIVDALEAGDTASAITMLEQEIELDPSYGYNYLMLGLIYNAREEYDKAEELFAKAVDKDKKFYPGYYELAKDQIKLGKLEEARNNMEYGLKRAKDMQAEFHNGLGLVLMAQGDYTEAAAEIRKALLIDSTNAEYYVNLGDVNFYRQVYPLAISSYETAANLDTASLDVYFRWAEACLEMKDYNCALEKLSIVLTKDSSHANAWMKAGGIYYKAARSSRQRDEAIDMYKKTIGAYNKYFELSQEEPDSTNGRAFYESAMSYLILNFFPEALENYRVVLSIPVEPKDIYFYYARAFQGNEQYDSALVYYEKHQEWIEQQGDDYETAVDDTELYRRMGECYEALKDRYNTIRYYTKSLEIDSTQERLLYGVAVAYNYVGDYENALIYYRKRIAQGVDERYWSIYYNAATTAMYLAEKGMDISMADDDLGLGDEPAAEPAVDPLAGVDFAALAAEYLEKVTGEYWDKVMENGNNKSIGIKALGMLGSINLYQIGDCQKGTDAFQRVLELEPENCEAMKSLGYAYFSGICPQNYSRALNYLNQAYSCVTGDGGSACDHPDLLLWIAQTYHFRAVDLSEAREADKARKDFKAAFDWYGKTLECDPANAAAQDGQKQVRYEY